MDRKQTRYGIKRGEREGIYVERSKNYDLFFKMYRSFIKKKGIKSVFDIFGVGNIPLENMRHGTLFLAGLDDEVLSAKLYLENTSRLEAWICVSKRLETNDVKKRMLIGCASRLIDWEAIKYAKEKGLEEFDLGGLWRKEDIERDIEKRGINSFKLSFGGKIVTCYSYEKIYSKSFSILYNLYNILNISNYNSNRCR